MLIIRVKDYCGILYMLMWNDDITTWTYGYCSCAI